MKTNQFKAKFSTKQLCKIAFFYNGATKKQFDKWWENVKKFK